VEGVSSPRLKPWGTCSSQGWKKATTRTGDSRFFAALRMTERKARAKAGETAKAKEEADSQGE
jgi:hypothetical protein